MFELPTEPMSIGKILDLSIRNFIRCFKPTIPLILLLIVINSIAVLTQVGLESQPAVAGTVRLVLAIPSLYISMSLLVLMCGLTREQSMRVDQAMAIALRLFPRMILFYILLGLATFVGLILLIIPGIILTVSLVLGQYALVLEDLGPMDALKRSHSLVWGGNWGKTAAVLTVVALIYIAVMVIVTLALGLLTFAAGPDAMTITSVLFSQVISAVLAPFAISTGLVLFQELRLRKEGSDLEMAIDSL